MFPSNYFAPRYFAPRYFPEVGADSDAVIIRACADLTQDVKPRAAISMQAKPIAAIVQRPC
jgi:hypothetical protein